MDTNHQKPIIGLLGGIGSGKTVVATILHDLGCAVIDADLLAREALGHPPIRQAISAVFGPAIFAQDGSIDRTILGGLAFEDGDNLAKLNSILHPWILERSRASLDEHLKDPSVPAIVLDMPLLMEVQWDAICDHIVFVDCPRETRVKRAITRGLSPDSLDRREFFQISLDKKANRADNVVINNSDLSSLVRQVTEIFTSITDC